MKKPTSRINPLTGKRFDWEAEQAANNPPVPDPDSALKAAKAHLAIIDRQEMALKAQDDFMTFIKFTSPDPEDHANVRKSKYKDAKHHRAIARIVQGIVKGEVDYTFLILTMPPRNGKSEIVSRRLPAWFSGLFPTENVVVATYSDDFAADFGKEVRTIMALPQYKQVFPGFRLKRGGAASDRLQNEKGGQLTFVGRGGGLTGRGAHCLICDDLIKDDKEAQSQAIRDQAWNWFTKVAMSRRMGRKIVIMTFCLTGDTPVELADGGWKRLDQIAPGDRVSTWTSGVRKTRCVTKISCQGVDDILELKTSSSTVKGNAKHPFLVARNGGFDWVRLGDLRVGDELVVSAQVSGGYDTISDDEAWALGFFLGDGWVTVNEKLNKDRSGVKKYKTMSFVSCVADCPKYPERVAKAISIMERKFGATFKKTKFGYWRAEKATLGRWLLDQGMAAGAKEKRVPRMIFSATFNVRTAFLDGFAAADGCRITKTGDQAHHNAKGGYDVTQVLLANPALIADLRHIARGLGRRLTNVGTSLTTHKPPNSNEAREWQNWYFRYHNKTSFDGQFRTEKVVSVTPKGRDLVYDVTVDGDENFIADGVVVHNTRWHADDPIGRLTDPENAYYNEKIASKIKVINLPAIAEDDDPLGRAPGEPLWPDGPDRFDLDFLEEQKSLDPIGFAALYQQRPSLEDGDLYQRDALRFYKPGDLPDDLRIYGASDHAVATGQRNDFTVLLKYGIDKEQNIYLLDCFWRKAKSDVVVEALLTMARSNMKPLVWFAEKGHISKAIGPFLRKRMMETGSYMNIREITPSGDKVTRAQSMIGRAAMGKLYFPIDAIWTEKAINQMMAFPSAAHDDFVDTLSLIGLALQSQFAPGAKSAKKDEAPAYGTLAWVKQADSWAKQERERASAGGF